MLTGRQATILDLIIREHIETALPVGSEALVRKYGLSLSSATIRNEMAQLEELGYINHPHTSSGRIPSDRGYRYYVEALMAEEQVTPDVQRTIRHQFHQAEREVEDQVHLAASVLARLVHNAGIAVAPRVRTAKLRQVQLVSLHEQVALAVAVLEDGRLCQSTVALPDPMTQDELTQVSRRLNEAFTGRRPSEFGELPDEAAMPVLKACREAIAVAVADDLARDHTYLEGLRNVLSQPEFARSDKMLSMLEALDQRNLQLMLPIADMGDGAISIRIGGENPYVPLQEATVIMGGYSGPAGMSGALGIVGPTRMEYARAIATVRYLSLLMGELLEDLYR